MSHVAESQEETTYVRSGSGKFAHDYREKMGWERMLVQPYGVSPIKYLQQWDVFDRDFLAVHCVQVSRDDIRILKAKDVAVAHCPKSNAKLGCGIAPLADLLHEGVRVGLGTDSPASSNIMDMFDEMRTMLFLHRAVERDVERAGRAARACASPRSGGAEALGLEQQVGSLEPGKRADFIAVDVARLALRAHGRPVLGAGLRRQPGRRRAHRGRWAASSTATVRTPALDAAAIRARRLRRAARSCATACVPARCASGRRIRLVASAANDLARGRLPCCSIVERVKFWQKWVFGFMAFAHGRVPGHDPHQQGQRLWQHQHVRRQPRRCQKTSRRLKTAVQQHLANVQAWSDLGDAYVSSVAASSSQNELAHRRAAGAT